MTEYGPKIIIEKPPKNRAEQEGLRQIALAIIAETALIQNDTAYAQEYLINYLESNPNIKYGFRRRKKYN